MTVLKARGLCKAFQGREVLRDVSLDVGERGVTALMGPSGCGKTTLLLLAAGLLKPDKGTVEYAPGLRLSMVFQEDRLLEWATARQNVALPLRGTRSDRAGRASEALTRVGLGGVMDQRVHEMSGGMKRRVALARALAADGGLLLLDEPFQGLDDGTRADVLAALKEASLRVPLLLVTHDERDAAALEADVRRLS